MITSRLISMWLLAECNAGSVDLHFRRAESDPESGGDFVVRQVLYHAHQQRGAVDLRQRLEAANDSFELVFPLRAFLRAGRVVADVGGQRGPSRFLAPRVQVQISRNGAQVGPQRLRADTTARRPQPRKRLRRDVLGVRAISGEIEGEAIHIGGVVPVQLRELRGAQFGHCAGGSKSSGFALAASTSTIVFEKPRCWSSR